MKPEQQAGKPDKEGRESLDNLIRQAIGKEPFLSFSRAGENPVHWIQFLHALDQQGTNKLSKGPKVDSELEGRDRLPEHCNGVSPFFSEINSVKESVPSIKGVGDLSKSSRSPPEHNQPLKIPEAVVAFAQAAAKANGGEPEKYLPGWPLLSPSKVQMQKCDKCSREFCSPINYRRHIRVHRRSLNIDKDSPKNREHLGQFWDKLSLDEAREIISFKNVALEEVAGSSIIRALTSFVRKPGLSSLPQIYVKAGALLLDVVQARPPRFPISSKELFLILDDASESTFLCAGTADSMQKFVFDGEVGKIGLEMRNLVACTSFLVEQKLVKAWLADKDAEALRCHKLLVEEEEVAQKRQAELLERKRLKKLRQKEQKAKEQADGDKVDLKESSPDDVEGPSFLAETSCPHASFESDLNNLEPSTNLAQPSLGPARSLDADVEANIGLQPESINSDMGTASPNADLANCQNVDPKSQRVVRRQVAVSRRPNLPRNTVIGFHMGLAPLPKLVIGQKHNGHRDQRATPLANGHKVWTRKTKPEGEREDLNERVQRETRDQPVQNENCEVLIGSICVTLGDCNVPAQDGFEVDADHQLMRGNNIPEKSKKPDSGQNGGNRLTVKLWRAVGVLSNSWHEGGGSVTVQSENREAEIDGDSGKAANRVSAGVSSSTQGAVGAADSSVGCKDSQMVESEVMDQMGLRLFSKLAAEAFLAQRWKEVMAADHVKLVLSEPSDGLAVSDSRHLASGPLLNFCGRSVLGNAENRLVGTGPLEPATTEASKPVFRVKPEKGSRLKYIPKQRNIE